MIAQGSRVLLVSADGRKFVIKADNGMIEVRGLGVIDGNLLCESSFGRTLRIGALELTILKPSIKDLLGLIERKAQVMIPKDSFMIPLHLDISCGSKVIEGGVGSGAMTLVLLKAVAPEGKVISYENREDHASVARRNVAMSEFGGCWDLRIDDVCKAKLDEDVDAAVIDIPNPWDAVDNVKKAIRVGGYLCCYIPNANQLSDTVKKMRDAGFSEVVSFETIQREMVVHEGGVRPSFESLGHTGYLAFGRKISGNRGT